MKTQRQSHKEKSGVKDYEKDIDPKDVVYKNDNVIILEPKTTESSIKYGRGSRWCTAADSTYRNYFFSYYYNQHVSLYYIIPLTDITKFALDNKSKILSAMGRRRNTTKKDTTEDDDVIQNLKKVAVAVNKSGRSEVFLNDDSPIDVKFINDFGRWLGIDDDIAP